MLDVREQLMDYTYCYREKYNIDSEYMDFSIRNLTIALWILTIILWLYGINQAIKDNDTRLVKSQLFFGCVIVYLLSMQYTS